MYGDKEVCGVWGYGGVWCMGLGRWVVCEVKEVCGVWR